MAASYVCQKNMLPYSSLGIPYSMLETTTISTPLPIFRQILARTVTPSLSTRPVDFPMVV
jgi:hypothetical protein